METTKEMNQNHAFWFTSEAIQAWRFGKTIS
jgi:hypothetical protein